MSRHNQDEGAPLTIHRLYDPNEEIPTRVIRHGYMYELQRAYFVKRRTQMWASFIRAT
jgi:hypothetical protein